MKFTARVEVPVARWPDHLSSGAKTHAWWTSVDLSTDPRLM